MGENITNSFLEHHILAIIEIFESNNGNLDQTEDAIFRIVYGILCCISGKEEGGQSCKKTFLYLDFQLKNYETYNRSARLLFSNKCLSSNKKQV